MLFVVLIIYELFRAPYYQIPAFIDIINFLDQLIIWTLISLYLVIHFFQLSYIKFSPTLSYFLRREIHDLGFEIQHKYKLGLFFLLFNGFSVIILVIISIGIYYSATYFTTSLIIRLVTVYIFSGLTIPILRGILHDKFLVKLKKQYFVQIDLQFKLIKHEEVESQMIRIYMTSNKLCLKTSQMGFNLHKEISEKKWLPRKGRFLSSAFQLNSQLHFHEYSTPINFKEHFLNIVSAIREWDLSHKTHNFCT